MNRLTWSAVLLLTGAVASAADVAAPKATEDLGQWVKVNEGQTGERRGSTIVSIPELKQVLLVGLAKGAPFVQAFDLETKSWGTFSEAEPFKGDLNNPSKQPAFSYQTAYDPGTKTIYCLSCGNVLYAFNTVEKTWKTLPAAPELEDLAWQTLACDPAGKRLVVVGAEKKGDSLGWSRTVVYDITAGKWQRLEVADAAVVKEHKELAAATESLIDLIGRIRLAWFRDPQGIGTDAERAALLERCTALKNAPQLGKFAADIDGMIELLGSKKTLEALKAARACQRKVEELAESQYPVPCSRRNSPLVYDQKNRSFVLFGGDHQDYLMNDTWILDLEKKSWRRARPDLAPSPRAGHALVYLPASGKIALYEGYLQSNNTDYAAAPYSMITPVQLWLYDLKADHWDLAGNWSVPDKGDKGGIAPVGYFYGGEGNNLYSAPALAADATDRLLLAGTDTKEVSWCRWKRPATTWALQFDPTHTDATTRTQLGTAANQRLYRVSPFRAEFCEVADAPKDTGLDNLPPNQWVKLPAPPRNPCQGCRGRDWSTSIWDPDRDEILLWGGGHCVRSASTVAHYSPLSGRTVEGFDADESYGSNTPADGTLARDSSVLGRPWISIHNYKHYAYDPKSKLLVAGRGYLYDPDRMDWLRLEKLPLPYRFVWGGTVLATSRHGVVAWAHKQRGDDAGLWLFDRQQGWRDLEPVGKLPVPWCDTHGIVYDSKRDRMLLSGVGGGYEKTNDGSFLAFDFSTKAMQNVVPANADLGKTRGTLRELAYVEHADWVLLGLNLTTGDPKTGKSYTRVYDCAANKMFLLDAGRVPDSHGTGWMYDARRKLVYVFTTNGEAWALKIEPKTAQLLEKPAE